MRLKFLEVLKREILTCVVKLGRNPAEISSSLVERTISEEYGGGRILVVNEKVAAGHRKKIVQKEE